MNCIIVSIGNLVFCRPGAGGHLQLLLMAVGGGVGGGEVAASVVTEVEKIFYLGKTVFIFIFFFFELVSNLALNVVHRSTLLAAAP